jgi:NADH-quinone oxidoreductase subunit G
MIEIQIDGRKVSVREGATVMDGATQLGIFVPHFCYHRKLSIAANCRMCLVDIEKSPKPMPACATPVAPGMVVRTTSARAREAQKSVMEFLLINHPLDCPICDQGGECQLQDLAVGYGGVGTRYNEEKRVVLHKSLGPLVSAEEMARCIHCTRCVRFGQEIAGVMELGMAGHGEHSQIMPFLGRTVDSELSGNLIDVCPVGALTSKPFRYVARTWELARRRSVAPHDSLGSNVVLQVKGNDVVRVVPLENEDVNECWISDRDRFSYEGLRAGDRLLRPMLRGESGWREADWPEALGFVAAALSGVRNEAGPESIGALASGSATVEELHLLARLVRAMGSESIDHRARQSDFSLDATRAGAPWLGMPVAQMESLDRVLLVGAFPRADQPLLAARLRKAAVRGAHVSVLHAADDDLAMPLHCRAIAAPSQWAGFLGQVAVAVARAKSLPVPSGLAGGAEPSAVAAQIGADLAAGSRVALFAGNAVLHHPQSATLQSLIEWISGACGGTFGVLGEGANPVGAHAAGAVPGAGGRNARTLFEPGLAAYLLWGLEPEHDCADPQAALAALRAARTVISFSSYRGGAAEYAHAILPIAAFAETAGTFVNIEGRVQSFQGAVRPPGDARPGWKVLRVLANELGLAGFQQDSPNEVRDEALAVFDAARLSNATGLAPALPASLPSAQSAGACERLPEVAAYGTDALVRRATSLQLTAIANVPAARVNAATLARHGLAAGASARFTQGSASAVLPVALEAGLADGVVRIPAGRAQSAGLGAIAGAIRMEKA